MKRTMLKEATRLAERGLAVLPLHECRNGICTCGKADCNSKGKHPRTKNGHKDATTELAQIREWWTRNPSANIGIACGASGLTVVDLDVKNGVDGIGEFENIAFAEKMNVETVQAMTPSGGRHLYYWTPPGVDLHNTAGTLGPGIDTRSNGGYVVAPPSVIDGKRYEWDFDYKTILELPGKLTRLLEKPKKSEPLKIGAKIPKGQRNTSLFKYASSLRAKGMDYDEILAAIIILNNRCEEPLPGEEIERIAQGAAAYEKGQGKYPQSSEYIRVLEILGYEFRLNELVDVIEVNGKPISDMLRARIKAQLRDLGMSRTEHAIDAIKDHSLSKAYHPIKEYLESLTWDGQDHIAALSCYFEDSKDAFPVFLRRWLVGSVAKIYDAYNHQNRMLVLDGKQNLGKSHFAKWLLPRAVSREYGIEGPIQPDNKDHLIRLASTWIWEVAELGSTTRKADREALKSFLTLGGIRVRKPYAEDDMHKPAMASFLGTVNNESGFLSDPSGNRRFMVSNITAINWAYAREIDVNQIWAQAKALFDAGETGELTPDERTLADSINKDYEIDDILESYFYDAFEITDNPQDTLETKEMLLALHQVGWLGERTQRAESMYLGQTCKRIGIEPFRTTKKRGYCGIKRKNR